MSKGPASMERRIAAGSLIVSISFAFSILQTLVQVPMLLRFWNTAEYGMWMAVAAATSMVIRLDAGHLSFVGNLCNRLWVEDKAKLRETFSSGFLTAFAIASVELFAGVLFLLYGRTEWLSGPVPSGGDIESFRIAFFAYLLFWVANGSLCGFLARLYQPAGLFARAQMLSLFSQVAGFIALMMSAALGASIAGAMVAQVSAWSVCNLYICWDIRQRFSEFFPWWRGGNIALGWRNFKASLVLTINGILDQFASSGLVLLVMGILAPVEVAVFTTIRTVANTAMQGVSVLLHPVLPEMVRYHFKQEPRKLMSVFSVNWWLSGTLVCLGFSAGAPIVEPLYVLWTRHALPFDPALFSLLAMSVAFRQWANPLQIYLHGINLLPPQTFAVLIRGVVTLSIAFAFLKIGGIRVAGLSLLAGEFFSAAVGLIAARRSIQRLGGSFHLAPVLLSGTQVVAMGVALFVFAEFPAYMVWSSAAVSAAILLLSLIQWKNLPPDVRGRILRFLSRRQT